MTKPDKPSTPKPAKRRVLRQTFTVTIDVPDDQVCVAPPAIDLIASLANEGQPLAGFMRSVVPGRPKFVSVEVDAEPSGGEG